MLPALIPLILGQFAQKAAPQIIDAVVDALVKDDKTPVTADNAQATKEALQPVLKKITSAGKWPIALGGLGSLFAGLSSLSYAVANGETNMEVYTTALGGVAGGVSILFGLWRSRRAAT